MNRDLVSIIIATYYRNEQLQEAIECSLQQTYKPIEIIVVDDSGEDHARSIATEYDINYLPHSANKGSIQARNTGIQAANGKYIQLLDDDDIIYPEKIEKQVALSESSSAKVVYGGIKNREGERVFPNPTCRTDSLRCALQFSFPAGYTSSFLISSELTRDIYPLKQRKAADDMGWKIELAKRTNFDYVDEILTHIRESEEHQSDSLEYAIELENIIKEYEHLYEQYPPEVRNRALRLLYVSKGLQLLNHTIWSPTAISSLARAVYYDDSKDWELMGSLFASFFGRPGINVGRKVRDTLL